VPLRLVGSEMCIRDRGRTVRLLSQLTNQVAMVQYPSLGRSRVRNIELIQSADTRVLLILITDSGRIQQHVIELNEVVDISLIGEIRGKLNGVLAGAALAEVAALLTNFSAGFSPASGPQVGLIVESLLDQVDANRQEKIILAGTANLARREEDFPGSISPVLEAIEEQVVLLKLITEMQSERHGVSLSIGRENQFESLANASVVVSGYENQGSEIAKLGVIGPTRMDYSSNISAVRAVARYLTKALGN
jgi:heat-inducible transcriptional repressor